MDNIKAAPIIAARDRGDVDISPCIENLEIFNESEIKLTLKDTDKVRVRLGEIVKAIFGINMTELEITRVELYGQSAQNNEWMEPL
jgi:hypothetical protein